MANYGRPCSILPITTSTRYSILNIRESTRKQQQAAIASHISSPLKLATISLRERGRKIHFLGRRKGEKGGAFSTYQILPIPLPVTSITVGTTDASRERGTHKTRK